MDFIAIDVETANRYRHSICQIGIAKYKNGELVNQWVTYVNPEEPFEQINKQIHGISENTVRDAPTFEQIADQLSNILHNQVVVSHSNFDYSALSKAYARYDLVEPVYAWLDSVVIAKHTWREFANGGAKLKSVSSFLGYSFTHHDALEDAKAAANIILCAARETGQDIQTMLDGPVKKTAKKKKVNTAKFLEGNEQGILFGEVVVFTGDLGLPRHLVYEMASQAGCQVRPRITKKSTMLVVGDHDLNLLRGHKKSSKQRKAEEYIAKGQKIHIISETEFKEIMTYAGIQSRYLQNTKLAEPGLMQRLMSKLQSVRMMFF